MKILWRAGLSLGVLLLVAGCGLLATEPPASWLLVEAPAHAIAGQTVPVRVTLTVPAEDTRLAVDLHWTTSRGEPRGFLSSSTPRWVHRHARMYTFEVPVPPQAELGAVTAVLYLSPSGRWEDRTAVAVTARIPVRKSGPPVPAEPISAYEQTGEVPRPADPSPALRYVIAGLWLLGGLGLRRERAAGAETDRLAVACLLAAAWELSNAELLLSESARAAALAQRLYYERLWLQVGATLAILAGTTALVVSALRRSPLRRAGLVRAVLWIYAAISLAGLVSFHETDRWLGLPVSAVPLAQVAKAGLAVATLALALWPPANSSAAAPAAAAAPAEPVCRRAE